MDERSGAVSRQHHRRHRPAGNDRGPLARFRPRGKPGRARRREIVGRGRRASARPSPRSISAPVGDLDTPMRISEDNALIIFSNLADNAVRHGSSTLDLSAAPAGQLAEGNRQRRRGRRLAQQPDPDLRQLFHHAAATAAEPGWASPSSAPCSTPMAAPVRLVESDRGTSFELTFQWPAAAADRPRWADRRLAERRENRLAGQRPGSIAGPHPPAETPRSDAAPPRYALQSLRAPFFAPAPTQVHFCINSFLFCGRSSNRARRRYGRRPAPAARNSRTCRFSFGTYASNLWS